MVPTEETCKALWVKYSLTEKKREHCTKIDQLATFLAGRWEEHGRKIDVSLLRAGALLHDLDKSVPRLPGERHPETAVRVLRSEGLSEVAVLIEHHSVPFILTPETAPKTMEEKILFLADKMVKQDVMTVRERFELWFRENLPVAEQQMLQQALPNVEALAGEILDPLGLSQEDVVEWFRTHKEANT